MALTNNPNKRKRTSDESLNENMSDSEEKMITKEDLYKDMFNFSRETRVLMHKIHLLCIIAYGNKMNSIINDELVKASILSLVPSPLIPTGPIDSDYFLDLMEWYRCLFVVSAIKLEGVLDFNDILDVFSTKRVSCIRDYVMLFVSMLRAMGFYARLVMSIHPYPINSNDFEVDSATLLDVEVIDTPGDFKITLKKGRGLVKSRKGKDILTARAAERLYNPLPIPSKDREKFVMKKYKTVLSSAVKRRNVKLDYWIEVFVKSEKRFLSLNIIHQTVGDIDSIYDNLSSPIKYCLAWTNRNNVKDVTKSYAPDWFRGTNIRRADKPWVDDTLAKFDKQPKRGRL